MSNGGSFAFRRMPRLVFLMRRLSRANYEPEMELLDLLCDRKRPGIDIGAKIGMHTFRIRTHSSEVIAFEPIPMFNRFLRAIFEGKRGRVEPYAVSNRRGTAKLRLPYGHDGKPKFGRSTIRGPIFWTGWPNGSRFVAGKLRPVAARLVQPCKSGAPLRALPLRGGRR